MIRTLFLATIAVFISIQGVSLADNVSSTFDTGSDGWNISDEQSYGPYGPSLGTYSVTWFSSNGYSGGYISGHDPTSNSFFFNAPGKFLGNKSSFYGGTLFFAEKSTNNNWSADSVVALVAASGQAIVSDINPLPPIGWAFYSIPLEPSFFKYNSKTGAPVSDADFRATLSNLIALRICGEYGSQVVETTGLDSVIMQTEKVSISGKITLLDYVGGLSGQIVNVAYSSSTGGSGAQDLILDGDGSYTISGLNPATYDLTFKASHWLSSKLTGQVAITDLASVDTSLINGDCDGDNEVTSTDLSILGLALGSSQGDANYDARADLDGDGEVTSTDLSILGISLGLSGE